MSASDGRLSPAFSVTFRSDCDRIVTETAPCPDATPDHRADFWADLWAVVSLSSVTSPEPSTDRDFDQVEVDATLASTLDSLDDAENYRNWIVELASPYLAGPILEVGAGHGTFTEAFTAFGDVTAVENPTPMPLASSPSATATTSA